MDNTSVENTLNELKRLSNRIIVKEDIYGIPSDRQQFQDVINSDLLLQEFCSFSSVDQFMILVLSDYVSNVFIHGRTDLCFILYLNGVRYLIEMD
jgi:hypothetical protein